MRAISVFEAQTLCCIVTLMKSLITKWYRGPH